MAGQSINPFDKLLETLDTAGCENCQFYNPHKLSDPRYARLPFSIRVLLEAAIRNCDEFQVCCCLLFIYTS